jgi:2-polyprenyl-3-methyl-5-hydroxy-6-metoxy-1,4-benzoquinol methylase
MVSPGRTWNPHSHYCDSTVAANYDRERFSSLAGRVYLRLERHALLSAFSAVPRGSQILDLPCGTGRLAEVLLEAGYNVVGADISAEMLTVAQRRLERFGARFSTQVKDVRSVSASDPRHPAVLCARVLMHFPLAEQIQFLAGVAALSARHVVITHSFNSSYQRARRRIKRVVVGAKSPAAYPISNEEIRTLLAETGLHEVRRIRLPQLISEAIILVAERTRIGHGTAS